jgi:hypothetical protein
VQECLPVPRGCATRGVESDGPRSDPQASSNVLALFQKSVSFVDAFVEEAAVLVLWVMSAYMFGVAVAPIHP